MATCMCYVIMPLPLNHNIKKSVGYPLLFYQVILKRKFTVFWITVVTHEPSLDGVNQVPYN